MKKIKSPVDLDHSFAKKRVVLKANEWAVFDDFHADEMKRIFPFIEIASADEADVKTVNESEEKKAPESEVGDKKEPEEKPKKKPAKRGRKSKK